MVQGWATSASPESLLESSVLRPQFRAVEPVFLVAGPRNLYFTKLSR